jgi:hypothetical protein
MEPPVAVIAPFGVMPEVKKCDSNRFGTRLFGDLRNLSAQTVRRYQVSIKPGLKCGSRTCGYGGKLLQEQSQKCSGRGGNK